jgi:hypothetical protein
LLTRLAGSRISLTGVALTWHALAGIALARASRLIRLHRLVVAVVFTSTATNFRIFHLGSFHDLGSVDNFDDVSSFQSRCASAATDNSASLRLGETGRREGPYVWSSSPEPLMTSPSKNVAGRTAGI